MMWEFLYSVYLTPTCKKQGSKNSVSLTFRNEESTLKISKGLNSENTKTGWTHENWNPVLKRAFDDMQHDILAAFLIKWAENQITHNFRQEFFSMLTGKHLFCFSQTAQNAIYNSFAKVKKRHLQILIHFYFLKFALFSQVFLFVSLIRKSWFNLLQRLMDKTFFIFWLKYICRR